MNKKTKKIISKENNYFDAILTQFEENMHNVIDKYDGAMLLELDKLSVTSSGTLIDNISNRSKVKDILDNLKKQLNKAGYGNQFDSIINRYSKINTYQREIFGSLGYRGLYGINDLYKVEAVFEYSYEDLTPAEKVGRSVINQSKINTTKISNRMRGLFSEAFFGSLKFNQLRESLVNNTNTLEQWSYAVANTGVMAVDSAIHNTVADELGLEYREYVGGIWVNTRPFCYAILKGSNPNTNGVMPKTRKDKDFGSWLKGCEKHINYWHIDEIALLDNEQGEKMKNVLLNAGGWNCHHRFMVAEAR